MTTSSMPPTRRLVLCGVVALFVGAVGPRVVGPQSRQAGTPFVYEPPESFVEVHQKTGAKNEGARTWTEKDSKDLRVAPRVVLNHSPKEMSVEEADLGRLVGEMAKAFEESCVWTHRRHEQRKRSDGARVGLIEGDCDKEVDLSAIGLPAQRFRSRKLQLIFPDDTGTSIVTASYPTEQAAQWEPLLEATIGKAQGVATRVPPPESSAYLAWGAAGLVVAWLATALLQRRAKAA